MVKTFAICGLRFATESREIARGQRRAPFGNRHSAIGIPNRKSQIANRKSAPFSPFHNRKSQIANRKSAFTLVEVLIAVAIALLLIVGISQIFAIAQRTTGMGTELLNSTAKDRSLQNTLNRDFHAILPMSDTPGLVIASYSAAMFRNKPDFDSASNQGDPRDFGPNFPNPSSAPFSQAFSTNARIHRLDRMCFFARDLFHRQTADSPSLSSSTTSAEGFVWYGHLMLPNNAEITNWDPANPGTATGNGSGWFNPGVPALSAPSNDNNQFASQMILGRQVMLMMRYPGSGESGFVPRPDPTTPPFARPYTLFLDKTRSSPAKSNDGTSAQLFTSRYDIVYNTIEDYKSLISNPAAFGGGAPPWWQQLCGLQFPPGTVNGDLQADQRFLANPFPTKPDPGKGTPLPVGWNSAAAAQTAPIFVRGCSQFIVEFAGDFTTQKDIDGTVDTNNADKSDGIIDYVLDKNTGQRRIRWYGLPRDTGTTPGVGNNPLQPDGKIDEADVMPVSIFTKTALRPFERQVPNTITIGATTWQMSNAVSTSDMTQNPAANVPMHSQAYVCGWGADLVPDTPTQRLRPTMIRITIAVDDPNGRLNNEQTYEYIFTLP